MTIESALIARAQPQMIAAQASHKGSVDQALNIAMTEDI